MTRQLTLSDDRYQTMVEMAAARSQTPEELLTTLVDEAWERTCALYDAAFQNDPGWQATAREASARKAESGGQVYSSTAALFQALGAGQDEVDEIRATEARDEPPSDAR